MLYCTTILIDFELSMYKCSPNLQFPSDNPVAFFLVQSFCVKFCGTAAHLYLKHAIALYYGFDFVTPTPPQCVERFHRSRSNEKNIIASLLKFARYIYNRKILPGNIFGLILENKMATTGVFRL